MGTDEFNRKAYDQRLIRFPKGVIAKFKELFGDEFSFNAWVVNLVVSSLLNVDQQFTDPPKM